MPCGGVSGHYDQRMTARSATHSPSRNRPGKGQAAAGDTSVAEQLGLAPGQSVELLKALHILTRDGKLNQGQPPQTQAGEPPAAIHRAAVATGA
jgi:hypothetical protein